MAGDCLYNDDSFTMLHKILFFFISPFSSRFTCTKHQTAQQHRRPTASEDFFYLIVFFVLICASFPLLFFKMFLRAPPTQDDAMLNEADDNCFVIAREQA